VMWEKCGVLTTGCSYLAKNVVTDPRFATLVHATRAIRVE
jgi:hypothetical protein